MSECYNCGRLEEKYDSLYRRYNKLQDEYSELKRRHDEIYDKLSNAEHRIHNELEPRIESEHRSYDSYVLNGGSDECFSNGMSGNCGIHCSIFGSKSECFDSLDTKEKILEAYDQHETDFDELNELIVEYRLVDECKEMSRSYFKESLAKAIQNVDSLKKLLADVDSYEFTDKTS